MAAAPLTAGLGVTDKASGVLQDIGYRARSYRASRWFVEFGADATYSLPAPSSFFPLTPS